MTGVRTGLDRIADGDADAVHLIAGRRIGLLAHAASVDRDLRPAAAVLAAADAQVVALFGPEHGFAGAAQDMVGVQGEDDREVPVYSLYGDDAADLSPKPESVRELDAIVIDLQDVGSRYYTYVWTAALTMKIAASVGTEVIVLDRPNPLGGVGVEGAPQRSGYLSFVGLHSVAVRHGLTIAELLRWVRDEERLERESVHFVLMDGWHRTMTFVDTGLPWVMPSPNMPTFDTATVYPGGCLVEGTTLSEGRGTTRPFELWGAPGLDLARLADLDLHGVRLRPLEFVPTFHKHAGRPCRGVQVHVTDAWVFRPYEAYLQNAGDGPCVTRSILKRTLAHRGIRVRLRSARYRSPDRCGPEFRERQSMRQRPWTTCLADEARGAAEFDGRAPRRLALREVTKAE